MCTVNIVLVGCRVEARFYRDNISWFPNLILIKNWRVCLRFCSCTCCVMIYLAFHWYLWLGLGPHRGLVTCIFATICSNFSNDRTLNWMCVCVNRFVRFAIFVLLFLTCRFKYVIGNIVNFNVFRLVRIIFDILFQLLYARQVSIWNCS